MSNKDALRAAMMKADFKSLRGGFKFTNHYPIQDFYLVKVAKRADGARPRSSRRCSRTTPTPTQRIAR